MEGPEIALNELETVLGRYTALQTKLGDLLVKIEVGLIGKPSGGSAHRW